MKNIFCVFLLALAMTTGQSAMAAKPETPKKLKGATVVTAEMANQLKQQGALMVDARVALEFVEEHILGATSIPYKERSRKSVKYDYRKDRFDVKKLPSDKNKPVVFYCNAGRCWKSFKASKAAIRHGFRKVYWLRGGLPEWKEKGLPVE